MRVTKAFQRRVLNPVVRRLVERGLLRGWLVLETTGRRSGEPRRTPVGYGAEGDTVWVVAEFGRRAQYVKNIDADPHVRVCVRGHWRDGIATPLPDEDARARLPRNLNSLAVRAVGTELLTIRIDLA
ncbi:MAG TPA: nitroreductase/quinone reductase family protein [Gaiellaceae bacterium]